MGVGERTIGRRPRVTERRGARPVGKELVFPSFRDLQSMYRLKFLGPDDLVRRENSERWIRVGDLPELRSVHLYAAQQGPWTLQLLMLVMLGAVALFVMGQFFFSKSSRVLDDPPPATVRPAPGPSTLPGR